MDIYIETYSTRLSVKNKTLFISNKEQEKTIPFNRINSINIQKGVNLTSDFLILCNEFKINVNITGKENFKLFETPINRRKQIEFFNVNDLAYSKKLISYKIQNQYNFVKPYLKKEDYYLLDCKDKINKTKSIDSIRGIEGVASKYYFKIIFKKILKDYNIKSRTPRRNKDIFNILLNYSYGILYRRVLQSINILGFDPKIGFLHQNNDCLLYDMVEIFRSISDKYVVEFMIKYKDSLIEVSNFENIDCDIKSLFLEGYLNILNSKKNHIKKAIKNFIDECISDV